MEDNFLIFMKSEKVSIRKIQLKDFKYFWNENFNSAIEIAPKTTYVFGDRFFTMMFHISEKLVVIEELVIKNTAFKSIKLFLIVITLLKKYFLMEKKIVHMMIDNDVIVRRLLKENGFSFRNEKRIMFLGV